ncbi:MULTISPECIES: DUF1194 domain-containing protein [unclassified Cyanobium]|uniref:DUF1194 domain-containing protein n=1 Tax=unclassified Cyanobium TaxID=2627006 RepID=UPI0020CCD40C|nr:MULTISPECIES: DUF1194 domain-containing protein [unclassified Cyanobium]MCP9860098.1 DUF1194 domain-containing protein [Cyanobium sp. Cruz-8H5]MCP9867308.1 DUF1194 domain-containing protein [Cyanobium sp. Cruz-8D1]
MRTTLKPLLRGGAAAAALAITLFGGAQQAKAVATIEVFQELFLSLDVSGSISDPNFTLYKNGYVNAFNNAAVQAKIADTFDKGGLAIAVGQWSTTAFSPPVIDWKHITDLTTNGVNGGTSLSSFIAALSIMPRQGSSLTCVDCGMNAAITEINTNDYFTTRANGRVIDISTDGVGNVEACQGNVSVAQCAQTRRAEAVASNIIINGLGVGAAASGFLTANVATPLNGATKAGFVETANTFDQFEAAITNKLIREVGQNPGDTVPGPLPLLGAAAAFGFSRKLRRRINTANLHQA